MPCNHSVVMLHFQASHACDFLATLYMKHDAPQFII